MDLPVGPLVPPKSAPWPSRTSLHGRYISLVPLQPTHAPALFKHLGGEANGHRWTYMLSGPFLDPEQWQQTVDAWTTSTDPFFFTVLSGPESDPTSEPVGMMSYLSIVPGHRRIELGSVILGEVLKQTRGASEAFYLLIKHAFEDLDYLRVEWKANHLNKPSLAAAERLGFVYEGIFRYLLQITSIFSSPPSSLHARKHMIVKGRRRDTAWYSITDEEWPVVKQGLEHWLSEDNFDEQGKQRKRLQEVRQSLVTSTS
ncbi:hypothetical protein AK830_g7528 [Neonectria ditissima]|uniref:N-acetyltransferase domain-containing protein n=1 Tax=Neonectria ditissima TaxID=78410 RepID=A0A0P7AWS6_9HYPO|nr:hypothetical protein AK830_g7528 [Neonectria ditissima]